MGTEIATVNGHKALAAITFSADQVDLLKRTIAPGSSDDELKLFIHQCQRTNLDPFSRQIYAIKRSGKMTIQTSIDGYRLIAERSGKYEGQTPAMWCGLDGVWKDVWLEKEMPAASKVGVYRAGFRDAVYAVAKWNEYSQPNGPMWSRMGALMLSKCAESLALRKAFPQELSGIYTNEEMSQADQPQVTEAVQVEAPKEEPDEIKAAWRKWRAGANKSFQAARSHEDLELKRDLLEKATKQGPDIWTRRTFHNETETFGTLYADHQARVERDEMLAGPNGIQIWITGVKHTPTVKGLASFVKSFREEERFQISECEEALQDRALQLGLYSYTDVEDDGTAPDKGRA